jgi:hypothetical protein
MKSHMPGEVVPEDQQFKVGCHVVMKRNSEQRWLTQFLQYKQNDLSHKFIEHKKRP